jgi:hypothetical protein
VQKRIEPLRGATIDFSERDACVACKTARRFDLSGVGEQLEAPEQNIRQTLCAMSVGRLGFGRHDCGLNEYRGIV